MKKVWLGLVAVSMVALLSLRFMVQKSNVNNELLEEVNAIWEDNMKAEEGEFTINSLWTVNETETRSGQNVVFYEDGSGFYYQADVYSSFVDEKNVPEQTIAVSEDGKNLIINKKNDNFEYKVKIEEPPKLNDFFDNFWEELTSDKIGTIVKSQNGNDLSYKFHFLKNIARKNQAKRMIHCLHWT